jgi:hypothetical protein
LGFAGAKMIRRILGLAHVEDLESIADPEQRARCETKALSLARELVVGARGFASLADVVGAARAVGRASPMADPCGRRPRARAERCAGFDRHLPGPYQGDVLP